MTREAGPLPEPVARYLRVVLPAEPPAIAGVRLRHTGTFNLRSDGERWIPFTSTQRVRLDPPEFDWRARMRLGPGVAMHVRDAYVGGEGFLSAKLLGVLPVMSLRGTPELAEGELMRWLAEAAWYPTALRPGPRLRWEPLDDRSARATVADGTVSASLTFHFGDDDLVTRVRSESRGRLVGRTPVPIPWEGRWSRYERRHGLLVPGDGEVAWIIDGERRPYWRGSVVDLEVDLLR
jgi:hypothetical protein